MKIDRFTWLGLGTAIAGWGILIADMVVSASVLQAGNVAAVMSLRSDVVTLAQGAIATGLALAIIGTLRTGFGTLHSFFDAVLDRSMNTKPIGPPNPVEPYIMTQPLHTAPADRVPSMGSIRERNYVILADGSVEVETLLGTRVFASLDEARDFIR